MTLFDLAIRSMRKNVKHYYLYFFALIFTVSLYFVFSTLQHDHTILEQTLASGSMTSGFKVANVLLIFIASIFIIYASSIFLKRRSKEIGIYQLIGLTKGAVARLLIIENVILNIGALFVGIGIGAVVSRLFVLLLFRLIGIEALVELSFSSEAFNQTLKVFLILIALTSLQIVVLVYRKTLIQLFQAERMSDMTKPVKGAVATIMALAGFGLIAFGYWLSANMLNSMLLINMVLVLASTILGTYLVFRIAISWLFSVIRHSKNGHLSLKDSLSIAPLMQRMKSNANSLTIITVLSAMTLTMVSIAYSLYYSNEETSRNAMPADFMFEADEEGRAQQIEFERQLETAQIEHATYEIPYYTLPIQFAEEAPEFMEDPFEVYVVSKADVERARIPLNEEVSTSLHYPSLAWLAKTIEFPKPLVVQQEGAPQFTLDEFANSSIFNMSFGTSQLVVPHEQYEQLKAYETGEEGRGLKVAIQLKDEAELERANGYYHAVVGEVEDGGPRSYYDQYRGSVEGAGVFIFIAAFLGFVFLLSTGSILYFKQMTEAEQEKQSYRTLRQLGFSMSELMSGIRRKQLFVFGLPLLIGLLHSWFAVQSASFLFTTDVTIPVLLSMGVYSLIYASFAILTIGYYKKVVKEAL